MADRADARPRSSARLGASHAGRRRGAVRGGRARSRSWTRIEADLERRAAVAETLVAARDQLAAAAHADSPIWASPVSAPAAGLDAALAAFAAGDSRRRPWPRSTATAALLAGAEEVGRGAARLAIAAGVVGLVLLAPARGHGSSAAGGRGQVPVGGRAAAECDCSQRPDTDAGRLHSRADGSWTPAAPTHRATLARHARPALPPVPPRRRPTTPAHDAPHDPSQPGADPD